MLPHHKHFSSYERNLPTRIGDAHYRYNAEGHRYYSEVGGVTMVTIMDGDRNVGTFRAVNGTNWQLSYWNIHGNGLEGRYDNPNVVFHKRFYHKDHLGSTRVVVNASGTIVGAYDYYPFGMELPGRSYTAGSPTHEKFTGHQRDEEVDLDYMIWRRYDPAFPLFMSVDPMASMYPGVSPYAYVLNNPLIYVDPTGESGVHFQVSAQSTSFLFRSVVSVGLAVDHLGNVALTGSAGFGPAVGLGATISGSATIYPAPLFTACPPVNYNMSGVVNPKSS